MSKLFDQLLEQRGFGASFLRPRYQDLTDPFVLPDMEQAINRIRHAMEQKERIMIYGDYDVDGVTASTALADTLALAGVPPERLQIMLPNRFTDGYGMSPRLVERAKQQGISLVITVDCGSRNHDIIGQLKKSGIDTIVTDHHECGDTLPDAVAIINPKRPDFPEKYQYLRDLAGVGVVFKLTEALRDRGLIPAGQEKWLLDLVLLGTICDSMPLTGENRILCYYGTKVITKTRRLGLRELVRRAGVRNFTSDSIGFQLGPRLNVAGRLRSADLSLQLLRTTSHTEAAALAEQLNTLNQERKAAQQQATKEIASRGLRSDPVLIEVGDWHEGIIGIVAGRLVEQFHRPSFVLTSTSEDPQILKGSARSFGDFNLAEALNHAAEHILSGGGHAAAAGVSLERARLDDFRAAINDYYRGLHLVDQDQFWRVRPDLSVSGLTGLSLDFLDELKTLEPYGEGNQKPIFRLDDIHITNAARLGADRQHLRLDVADRAGNRLKIMAFSAPSDWLALTPEDHIAPLITLESNTYQGVTSVEARLLSPGLA